MKGLTAFSAILTIWALGAQAQSPTCPQPDESDVIGRAEGARFASELTRTSDIRTRSGILIQCLNGSLAHLSWDQEALVYDAIASLPTFGQTSVEEAMSRDGLLQTYYIKRATKFDVVTALRNTRVLLCPFKRNLLIETYFKANLQRLTEAETDHLIRNLNPTHPSRDQLPGSRKSTLERMMALRG